MLELLFDEGDAALRPGFNLPCRRVVRPARRDSLAAQLILSADEGCESVEQGAKRVNAAGSECAAGRQYLMTLTLKMVDTKAECE